MTAKKKSALGANPLDAFGLNEKAASKASKRGLEPAGTTPRPPRAPEPVDKVKAAFYLPVELVERARDAAYWGRVTMAQIAEDGLRKELDRLAKEAEKRGERYAKDGDFIPREGQLKAGRRAR